MKLFYRARVELKNDNLENAVGTYKKIIEIQPKLAEPYLYLGVIYLKDSINESSISSASSYLKQYLALKPDDPNAFELTQTIGELDQKIKKKNAPAIEIPKDTIPIQPVIAPVQAAVSDTLKNVMQPDTIFQSPAPTLAQHQADSLKQTETLPAPATPVTNLSAELPEKPKEVAEAAVAAPPTVAPPAAPVLIAAAETPKPAVKKREAEVFYDPKELKTKKANQTKGLFKGDSFICPNAVSR